MTVQHDDGPLVVRVQDGDLEALGELYEKYKTSVYRTALAITREEKAAEDILQEAFLRVYTYAHSIDKAMPLGPSWTRQVKRWLQSLQDVMDRWTVPVQWHPETLTEEQEWRQILLQAIDALPPRHRVVVILHYLEELSLKEIAYVLEVPEGTVKSRLHYARENLKRAILEREHRLVPEVAYDFT
jgi:RNA polymerase sigma-70 factor (ECF subfamily)